MSKKGDRKPNSGDEDEDEAPGAHSIPLKNSSSNNGDDERTEGKDLPASSSDLNANQSKATARALPMRSVATTKSARTVLTGDDPESLRGVVSQLNTVLSTFSYALGQLSRPTAEPMSSTLTMAQVWGQLVPLDAKQMSVPLGGPAFTIGRGTDAKCNLQLRDPAVNGVCCRLHLSRSGRCEIESYSSLLFVNHRQVKKNSKRSLKGGDEIILNLSRPLHYVFEPLPGSRPTYATPLRLMDGLVSSSSSSSSSSMPSVPAARRPSMGLMSPLMLPPPTNGYDKMTPSKTLHLPTEQHGVEPTQGRKRSRDSDATTMADEEGMQRRSRRVRFRDDSKENEPKPVLCVDDSPDADSAVVVDVSEESPLTLPTVADVAMSDVDEPVLDTVTKTVLDGIPSPRASAQEGAETSSTAESLASVSSTSSSSQVAPPVGTPSLVSTLTKQLKQRLVAPTQPEQPFSYWIAPELKQLLESAMLLYLRRPDLAPLVNNISSLSRRLLLCGPPGSERMQELLLQSVAAKFQTHFLVLDLWELGVGAEPPLDPVMTPVAPSFRTAPSQNETDEDVCTDCLPPFPKSQPISTLWAEPTHKTQPRIIKNRLYQINDRVKFVGLPSPVQDKQSQGPLAGMCGRVVWTWQDNPKRVGVQFDQTVAGGSSLHGKSEPLKGCLVQTSDLVFESEADAVADSDAVSCLLEALFHVLEDLGSPCIVCIREVDKGPLASDERHLMSVKSRMDSTNFKLPVVFVGCKVQAESTKSSRPQTNPTSIFLPRSAMGSSSSMVEVALMEQIAKMEERAREFSRSVKLLSRCFPVKVQLFAPTDSDKLDIWRKQMQQDSQLTRERKNALTLARVMKQLKFTFDPTDQLDSKSLRKRLFSTESIRRVLGWAVTEELRLFGDIRRAECTSAECTASRVSSDPSVSGCCHQLTILSSRSVRHGIKMFTASLSLAETAAGGGSASAAGGVRHNALRDVQTDNDFERRLLDDVIPAHELRVEFGDIGALDSVKTTLQELVMLPLLRPELFRKGNLSKPCKGILLFGPPGTGKTMLAKAVATQAGASFISCSMSSIASKWFGEGEKYVKALFSLASKIAPCVIFVDEVDSMLGRRDKHGEHEASRKMKNEFMANWDGLRSREGERVLVLAATNRPFDLDDAVLRRLPRRLLVDMPDKDNRKKILQVILSKEELDESVDLEQVAAMTEGFSGSDLKHLCVSAAYQPIREILAAEVKEMQAQTPSDEVASSKAHAVPLPLALAFGRPKQPKKAPEEFSDDEEDEAEESAPCVRALSQRDFDRACNEVSGSVSEDAFAIQEIRKWNDTYGDGGRKRHDKLSYFL